MFKNYDLAARQLKALVEGRLLGVLDIDSPVKNRFDEEDRDGLEQLMSVFSRHL